MLAVQGALLDARGGYDRRSSGRAPCPLLPNERLPMPANRAKPPNFSTYDVMLVQESLRALGLYDGPIDGEAGAKTLRAARAYKRRNGLFVDDTLGRELVRRLRETV